MFQLILREKATPQIVHRKAIVVTGCDTKKFRQCYERFILRLFLLHGGIPKSCDCVALRGIEIPLYFLLHIVESRLFSFQHYCFYTQNKNFSVIPFLFDEMTVFVKLIHAMRLRLLILIKPENYYYAKCTCIVRIYQFIYTPFLILLFNTLRIFFDFASKHVKKNN